MESRQYIRTYMQAVGSTCMYYTDAGNAVRVSYGPLSVPSMLAIEAPSSMC